jgi:hypothetical protein
MSSGGHRMRLAKMTVVAVSVLFKPDLDGLGSS